MNTLTVITTFFFSIIAYNISLLYGTVGEIITEKSGSLNLGVEGTMAVGAMGGYLVGCATNSFFMGLIMSFVIAALCGLIFAFLTVTLQANQNVTGLTMTTFGGGLFFFIAKGLGNKYPALINSESFYAASQGIYIKGLSDIPFIGKVLFSQAPIVYIGIVIAIIAGIYIKHTRAGLRLRAVGENPSAADAVGINITRTKYINIMLGSGIMGIGGLSMCLMQTGSFAGSSDTWISGYGWIAIALVIFANWSPFMAIAGTVIFGFFNTIRISKDSFVMAFPNAFGWLAKIPGEFFEALPFIITAIVLIINSAIKKKNSGAPKSLGVNYYREDR